MSATDRMDALPVLFRGEPGEPSEDAIGGWSAEDARSYRDFAIQRELREYADLYGWDAVAEQVSAAVRGEVQ